MSAAQPPVDELTPDRPFIEPTRLSSQALDTHVTGASVMSAASRLVNQPSTQKPVTSSTLDAHLILGTSEKPGTTSLFKSSVEKLTTIESVKQSYRDTVREVRSFMGWSLVPEFESAASFQDYNPFASSRSHSTSKISVKLPSDTWLCQKLEKLNLILSEG